MDLIDSYYFVGNHMREQACQLLKTADYILSCADQMSEKRMKEQPPEAPAPTEGSAPSEPTEPT